MIQIPENIDLTLEWIEKVLNNLGNPHHRLPKVVHVAGTNGKGSTISFLRAILEAEGYRTHIYTSPHLVRVNERIKIAGKDISDDQLRSYSQRVRAAATGIELSYFEELTAVAFLAFSEYPADFSLIEVGLGGRLDATNVVIPEIVVITPISYDHQDILGQSIQEITLEKAGIIKAGIPVVCAPQKDPQIDEIIRDRALRLECSLLKPTALKQSISLGLVGDHQYDNAATALAAADRLLGDKQGKFSDHLKQAIWPGRLQKLFESYDLWVDGAHNKDGIAALVHEVRKWKQSGHRLVIGVSQLSNRPEDLLTPLFELADEVYHIDMQQGARFRPPPKIAKKTILVNEVLSYFMQPNYNGTRILFTGSLYMVGEILNTWEMIDGSIK